MGHQSDDISTNCATSSSHGQLPTRPAGRQTSRRQFLQSSAGVLTAGAAVPPGRALAQGAGAVADAELARLQGARRILLKGGVVLSLDRQVGDFARADLLIEDGKIREIRPDITVSGDGSALVDAG